MAYELGEAYISISMASGGLAGKIRKEIGVGSDEGSRAASSNITSRFSGAFASIGKLGVTAIGTIGAAVTGIAIGGGLNRALQIDNAKASLKGLKLSMADIDNVMKSANEAADGTAFGLGEAAGAAATLKAAGIGVGAQMTRQLTIIADAATQSGKEISSLSPIWSKMAADGRVSLGNLSQLTFNQVPAVAALAEHFGKTQAEIRKMASTGQISFEEFSVAMEKYIGGAFAGITGPAGVLVTVFGYLLTQSPQLREMFGTVLQTALQAVSTLLQTVLIPALSGFLGFLADHPRLIMAVVIAFASWMAINALVSAATNAVQGFTAIVNGASTTVGVLSKIVSGNFAGAFGGLGAALSGAKTAITGLRAAFVALNLTMLSNPIFLIVAAIAALVAGFIYLWNTSEGFRNFWIGLWEGIRTAFMAVWNALSVAFTAVWEGVLKPVFDAIVNVVQVWWNTWMAIFGFISAAWNTLLNFLTGLWVLYGQPLFDGIGQVLGWLWTGVFQPVLQWISDRWNGFIGFLGDVWTNVGKPVFDAIGNVLGWLWTSIYQPVLQWISDRWNGFIGFLGDVWTNVGKPIFDGIGNVLGWLWTSIYQPILNTIGKAWDGFVGGMKNVAEGAFKGIGAAFEALGHALEWVWKTIIEPVWDVISGAFKAIGDWFGSVTGKGAEARGQASFSAAAQAAFTVPVASYAAITPRPLAAFATPSGSPISQLASSLDRLGERERAPRGDINIELHNQPDYLVGELTRQLRWLKVV